MTDEDYRNMIAVHGVEYMEKFFPRIMKARKWAKEHEQ